MKTKILTFLAFTAVATLSCNRYDSETHPFDNTVFMDVSSVRQDQATTFGNNIEAFTREITAQIAYPAEKNVKASIKIDKSLVDQYNGRHGTDYEMLPERYYDFAGADVTIPAGRTYSESVSIGFKGLTGEGESHDGALTIDKTWLLPVRMTSSDLDVLNASSVAYYLVRRSSAITSAARLTDNWINFPSLDEPGEGSAAFNGLKAVTYEALIYIDRFDLTNSFGDCNISSIMGVEQYLLLRIGDTNFERQQLQFDGSGGGTTFGKFPASDPGKKLYEGRWYHVACTYDYNTRTTRVYVNGRIQSEGLEMGSSTTGINLAQRALGENEAYQFFIGKSYNDFRPLQGMIAEARVWSVARTPEQIWENMYRIENPEADPTLIGYWKFDEGKGNPIKDHARYGNDGVAQSDIIWPAGIEIPEINKED